MPSLADAMKTLTAQYYNALTGGLRLNPQQEFQITQGQIALGATSQNFWGYLDTIPPVLIANTWSPGGQNTFSSQYGAVISRLKDLDVERLEDRHGRLVLPLGLPISRGTSRPKVNRSQTSSDPGR